MDLLQYLHRSGLLATNVEDAHLGFLKYLHQKGCNFDGFESYQAAKYGHLKCLKYLHGIGCPLNFDEPYVVAKNGHLECLKYLHEDNGHLECLKYLHEKGCPWHSL